MGVSIILLVGLWIYVITRDIISKKKRERDLLMKKRISGKLDRIENKVNLQTKRFESLLKVLEDLEG